MKTPPKSQAAGPSRGGRPGGEYNRGRTQSRAKQKRVHKKGDETNRGTQTLGPNKRSANNTEGKQEDGDETEGELKDGETNQGNTTLRANTKRFPLKRCAPPSPLSRVFPKRPVSPSEEVVGRPELPTTHHGGLHGITYFWSASDYAFYINCLLAPHLEQYEIEVHQP